MHKRVLAGLPILAAVLIFTVFLIVDKVTTPAWKSELNQYINFKATPPYPAITLQQAIQADKPWQFNTALSAITYSDCYYFATINCYDRDGTQFAAPLLYPPEDVWCALVKISTDGRVNNRVVYVAKYEDLYNSDWIVYENTKSITDPQLQQDLADLGCGPLLALAR